MKNAKKYYEQKLETKVDFEEVGVKAVQGGPLTFELHCDQPKSLFKVVNSLNMVILVPPKSYDAAFQNDAQTQSSYGTVNFPFQSYGPYVLKEWSNNQKFVFNKNYNYFDKNKVAYKSIVKRVVMENNVFESMFEEKKINALPLMNDPMYHKYKQHPLLKMSPVDKRQTLCFNNVKRGDKKATPKLLEDLDFKKAVLFALNRSDVGETVDVFSDGELAVVPKITSFLEEPLMYNESEEHKANIQDFEPENKGYNPTKAYELFKKAYNHLFDADKQKTVEIEFLVAKTQEERVNLARFVKKTN
ncbi:ABC transporter substrate-binding protein [Paulownia witches'-broom phytoplasma]|uniref:ABC transporter substrate-binding protein n=1 Tax=Paulownia witches'-broom phytoplasma TaxID=39647 RepID=UPI002D1F87D2|nr:hypothetical protein PAWBP_4010 [Paulownia witches'-broom phytoplasma]